jgi:hypothetical protein
VAHLNIKGLPLAEGAERQARHVEFHSGAKKVYAEIYISAITRRAHYGKVQLIIVLQSHSPRYLVYACYIEFIH